MKIFFFKMQFFFWSETLCYVCIFYFFFTGPYTTSKYADYNERLFPSPSNSENADVSQNSLIKSPFHQNVLTPTVELGDSSLTRNNLDSSSTRNFADSSSTPIQNYSNSVTSTESLYNGYNRLRFITGGWKNSFIFIFQ